MHLMQCYTARFAEQPMNVDDIEILTRRSMLKDVYGFFASGSILGNQQTLKENRTAYKR